MKKNLLLLSSMAFLIAASGCLSEEPQPEDNSEVPAVADPRPSLIHALDSQATQLISGINQVIITGNFVKNMAVENPPQPIPLGNDNDIQKAISYLLANQSNNGKVSTYKPDPRFCTELVAKDHPASCVQFLSEVTLTQTQNDANSGSLEVSVGQAQAFVLSYSSSSVSVSAQVSDVVKALQRVSFAMTQNGESGFAASLPTVYDGALNISLSSALATSLIKFSITQAIDIEGMSEDGRAYALKAQAAQNSVSVLLNSALGIANVSLALPAVTVNMSAHDDQNTDHDVEIQFPGASGSLSLDNSLEKIAIEALHLASADIYIQVDGQTAVHGMSNSQIDAELQSAQGGNFSVSFLGEFSAQAEFSANPLIPRIGGLAASIAQGSQVYFPFHAEQAKVLQGEFQLLGTMDFAGSMDAQVNSCIQGNQNGPLFLETAVCGF